METTTHGSTVINGSTLSAIDEVIAENKASKEGRYDPQEIIAMQANLDAQKEKAIKHLLKDREQLATHYAKEHARINASLFLLGYSETATELRASQAPVDMQIANPALVSDNIHYSAPRRPPGTALALRRPASAAQNRKRGAKPQALAHCPICKVIGHDKRSHRRRKDPKKPFTKVELAELARR